LSIIKIILQSARTNIYMLLDSRSTYVQKS